MTTKSKILDTSRTAFNAKGVGNVTVRDICRELNISVGNFSYHYPNKDQIVEELYSSMTTEIEAVYRGLFQQKLDIVCYLDCHKKVFSIQIKYKFFYLNLFEILTKYPKIAISYRKSNTTERANANELFGVFKSAGIIRDDVATSDFERILNIGQIVNNAWLIDAEILFSGSKKKQLKYYMSICCGLIEPYLTEKSKGEFNDYFTRL